MRKERKEKKSKGTGSSLTKLDRTFIPSYFLLRICKISSDDKNRNPSDKSSCVSNLSAFSKKSTTSYEIGRVGKWK